MTFKKLIKVNSFKSATTIRYNLVRYTKSIDDMVHKEAKNFICLNYTYRNSFCLLKKVVYSKKDKTMTFRGRWMNMTHNISILTLKWS